MVNAFTLAQSLRAIGQALDKRKIRSCHVIRNCENFLVQVKNGTPFQQRYRAGLIKQRRRPIKIHFTLFDIYRHEQQARCKRKNPHGTPDFYSLPQVMRTVGEYLDCKNATLNSLYLDGIHLTIRYESEHGHKILEHHTIPALYDFFVHMYLRRKRRMKLVA
jgi:hypothetical protein